MKQQVATVVLLVVLRSTSEVEVSGLKCTSTSSYCNTNSTVANNLPGTVSANSDRGPVLLSSTRSTVYHYFEEVCLEFNLNLSFKTYRDISISQIEYWILRSNYYHALPPPKPILSSASSPKNFFISQFEVLNCTLAIF